VLLEGLGALLEQNLIDIKMVDSLFGSTFQALERCFIVNRHLLELGSYAAS